MVPRISPPPKSPVWGFIYSRAAGFLAYGLCVVLAAGVTAVAVQRVVETVADHRADLAKLIGNAPSPAAQPADPPIVHSQVLEGDEWNSNLRRSGTWGQQRSYAPPSSRLGSAPAGPAANWFGSPFGDDDNEDGRPQHGGTYRTVCVRLCDGYYFPISFTTTPENFGRDQATCERSCSSDARLYVYRNPGGDQEHMQDLRGQPYSKLKTAFLYRTSYDAACRCKPDPWSQEATNQHRGYALVALQRKSDRKAAAELAAMKSAEKASKQAEHAAARRKQDEERAAARAKKEEERAAARAKRDEERAARLARQEARQGGPKSLPQPAPAPEDKAAEPKETELKAAEPQPAKAEADAPAGQAAQAPAEKAAGKVEAAAPAPAIEQTRQAAPSAPGDLAAAKAEEPDEAKSRIDETDKRHRSSSARTKKGQPPAGGQGGVRVSNDWTRRVHENW
jgi:hypothetical protein